MWFDNERRTSKWHRRQFLSAGARAGMTAATGLTLASLPGAVGAATTRRRAAGFRLKYAPHFGMFRHSAGGDELDQLRFAADQGFAAWEDNGMKGRTPQRQQQIANTMSELGMQMGVISASHGMPSGPTFSGDDAELRDKVVEALRESVEVAKRVNCTWMTVVPGMLHLKLPLEYQTANCIELLERCCDIVEPHGLTMVIEPLNHKTNHPGLYLTGSPQAYLICKAVGRKSLKILFDIYHQQITEGNLIPNIDHCWEEIGYFQCGDNPGRKEPGTGEINYRNVFGHIHEKGFGGIVGMEHGNARKGVEGERALIEAYRRADDF